MYLSQGQLRRLKEHKYCSEGKSIAEYVTQPFWNWCIQFMPLWVAPNLITISGLILNIITSSLLILYSPQANNNQVPSYVFILCAIGLFIYQTLDAIDGKQARRTNTSSPLGELFDHGCDAVSTICVTVSLSCALSFGVYPNHLFLFFMNNSFLYYFAHWTTYCSGKLQFGLVDVTEAQLLSICAYTVAGLFGPVFFLNQIQVLSYSICWAKVIISYVTIGSFCYIILGFRRIFRGGVGKNGTTVAHTSVLSPIVPIGILFTCAFYVFKHSEEDLFASQPCLFMMTFGACTAKLTCNLVIASMSKTPLEMLDACMIGPILLTSYIYAGGYGHLAMMGVHLPEYYVLIGTFVFNIVNFVQYSIGVCTEISTDFGIKVFRIPYTEDKKSE